MTPLAAEIWAVRIPAHIGNADSYRQARKSDRLKEMELRVWLSACGQAWQKKPTSAKPSDGMSGAAEIRRVNRSGETVKVRWMGEIISQVMVPLMMLEHVADIENTLNWAGHC